jgi:site-specific DNA recombinase
MGEVTAAIYARVSTEQQTRGNTVASQLALLRDRAETDKVRLEPDHTFVDEGYSGSTLVRPALERLRDAVADNRIDRVYILAPDRLARRYAYQVLLVEEFRRSGAEVVFLNRSIGSSAEDDLLLQVQGVIAEYERAKILERGRRGRRHAAQTGAVSALCGAPFGYRYIGRHVGGGLARVEPCGDEARIVRSIFRWVGVDRISLREVCRRLLKMGCVTRTGKVRWDPTTICGMLRNPVYRGAAMFGRTRSMPAKPRLRPIGHRPQPSRRASGSRSATPRKEWIEIPVPALIDEALFEAAQVQLEENRKRKREGRRRPGWLLQGLVVCHRCGYAFYGKMARGLRSSQRPADYGYYRCTGTDAHRFGGQATCDNRSVRSDKLDQAVWAEVQTVLKDPARLADEYRRRISEAQTGGGARDDLNTLDGQIARLRSGIERLIDSYAEGIIGRAEFEPRINGLKQRIGRLENDRKALTEKLELERDLVLVIGRLEEFTSRLQIGLGELDWRARRDVIRALVRRIEIDHDKIEVVFRVPGPSSDGGNPSGPPSPTDPGPLNWQHCGNVHHPADRRGAAGAERRMAIAAPLHAGRGDGRTRRASERGRGQADRMCGMTALNTPQVASSQTRERQTVAPTAPMPNARPWRRGQAPQPRSGAPKAQGLTAAIPVAAPSPVPSIALDSTGVKAKIDTSTTSRIYTSLTDVTHSTSLRSQPGQEPAGNPPPRR